MLFLILTLALVGFVCWCVVTYIPMPEPFKTGIIALAVILALLYVLSAVGFVDLPIPRIR